MKRIILRAASLLLCAIGFAAPVNPPPLATTNTAGLVKPDGTTITIGAGGLITSVGGTATNAQPPSTILSNITSAGYVQYAGTATNLAGGGSLTNYSDWSHVNTISNTANAAIPASGFPTIGNINTISNTAGSAIPASGFPTAANINAISNTAAAAQPGAAILSNAANLRYSKLVYPAPDYIAWTNQHWWKGGGFWNGPSVWDQQAQLWRQFYSIKLNTTNYWLSMGTSADDRAYSAYTNPGGLTGTAGIDSYSCMVPGAMWCEPYAYSTTRPWRVIYIGNSANGTIPTLMTSADGNTWSRLDAAGNTIINPLFPKPTSPSSIDSGNVLKYGGNYYFLFNDISAPRGYYLATCPVTDTAMTNWSMYLPQGTPDGLHAQNIFTAWLTTNATFDYQDVTQPTGSPGSAASTTQAGGQHNGWIGQWTRPDGQKEFLLYTPACYSTNTVLGQTANVCDGVVCWSSTSPYFEIAKRTFRGWVMDAERWTNNPVEGQFISLVDLVQANGTGPEQNFNDVKSLSMTANTVSESVGETLNLVRPAGLPTDGTGVNYGGAVFIGAQADLDNNIILANSGSTDAGTNTVFLMRPAITRSLVDESGQELHFHVKQTNPSLQPGPSYKITIGSGVYLGADSVNTNYLASYHYGTHSLWCSTNLTFEFCLNKQGLIGTSWYVELFADGNSSGAATGLAVQMTTTAAGDTACKFNYQYWDGTTIRTATPSATFNFATNVDYVLDIVRAGNGSGNFTFWTNGVQLGTTITSSYVPAPYTNTTSRYFLIGNTGNSTSEPWPGWLKWVRFDQTNRTITPAGIAVIPSPAHVAAGAVYSGVYDFGAAAKIAANVDVVCPSDCTCTVLYRAAASASDRYVGTGSVAGDAANEFTTTPAASRYGQFAIYMTSATADPTGTAFLNTPRIRKIEVVGEQ